VPTSSSEATRPRSRTSPRVGAVMRDKILSSVDLPAPLRPMMPTASPGAMSNDTSSSAQKVGSALPKGARTSVLSVSRRLE
jgi:hypothetical protein